MPVRPYTIAARVLHYGRYGRNSEDVRLMPLFVGYPGLVRGYQFDSFSANECRPTATSPCPVFDQLVGSRLAVGNLELRFPLIGAFMGEIHYGPLPVEGVLFADAGVAWNGDVIPTFLGGERDLVRSVGAGVRINALGFAVVEVAAAHPLDRPGNGWLLTFNLIPGF
jgi:outer membrane protein assembly factor BamA